MTDVENWLPDVPPVEYLGSDLYGAFGEDTHELFSDASEKDFRTVAVRETIRSLRVPARLARNRDPSTSTAGCPPAVEAVPQTAKEAARAVLGLRAHEVLWPSAVLWVVRDCGVSFCHIDGEWREIERPHEAKEPRRYSVSLYVPTGQGKPGCPIRPVLRVHDALALYEIKVAANELCVVLTTSGLVASQVWTMANKGYPLATGGSGAAAVFPVSFPEAAALGLVEGIRVPFDSDPRGPGDILRTELIALAQSPEERVGAAARWLSEQLTRRASFMSRTTLAHDEARRVLGLGRKPSTRKQ